MLQSPIVTQLICTHHTGRKNFSTQNFQNDTPEDGLKSLEKDSKIFDILKGLFWRWYFEKYSIKVLDSTI